MIIELNAGMGGMTEGMRLGGIEVTHAIDWSADACASHRANLDTLVLQRDVRELARGNWQPGTVELLVADTPCQPYSSAGLGKGADDERDLLSVTIDMVERMRPRTCLISNVPGLTFARHANALGDMLTRLKSAGYCVDHCMMNGADYGLPQIRKRPWWFGHLDGPCIQWPAQTHWKPKHADLLRRSWVTIGDAFSNAFGAEVTASDLGYHATIRWKEGTSHRPGQWGKPARTLTHNPNGDGALLSLPTFIVSRKHPPSSIYAPSGTITARPRETNLLRVDREHRPVRWTDVARTITSKQDHAWYMQTGLSDVIVLNERARLVLQGFPPDWTIVGKTKRSRDSQIGLAMPPPMACAVARSIVSRVA